MVQYQGRHCGINKHVHQGPTLFKSKQNRGLNGYSTKKVN